MVTLAASVVGSPRANHVWHFYEFTTGQPAETLTVPPPSVPSTSVYSRVDGLSNWRTCLQPAAPQQVHRHEAAMAVREQEGLLPPGGLAHPLPEAGQIVQVVRPGRAEASAPVGATVAAVVETMDGIALGRERVDRGAVATDVVAIAVHHRHVSAGLLRLLGHPVEPEPVLPSEEALVEARHRGWGH